MNTSQVILVTGATGAQGGGVVDALLRGGNHVRALVRDPQSHAAKRLSERGVQLVPGHFEDARAVRTAVEGADGVFSMQLPPHPKKPDTEVAAATILVEAAEEQGVRTFVHTSVARAGDHDTFVGWDENRWWKRYWTSKAAANDVVRSSKLAHWVILKPAFMMDNFIPPKADYMFPQLREGQIISALEQASTLDLIAASDIGRVASAAFTDVAAFDHQEFDLAAESLTMTEIGEIVSSVTATPIQVNHLDAESASAAGTHVSVVESQLWASVEGYQVDLASAARTGIDYRSFAQWAKDNRERFAVG
ncbi:MULTISPECIES: NmrA family NAD(P)-binding protein [Actinomycetes]|uniref:NmrA family NAD(P)-binding protein n=1 Tax=Actinomycetes TaxID=1760 RepID=UPI0009DFF794|nr:MULTISPECIES: NmrA family NAD(P)-binding protein [Actinomycetes]